MTDEEREPVRASGARKPDGGVPWVERRATERAESDPQKRIADDVRSILLWVRFFGLVLILGLIGGCLVLVWREVSY